MTKYLPHKNIKSISDSQVITHFSGRLALEKLLGCTVNEDGSVNMATDAVAADAVADATGGKG